MRPFAKVTPRLHTGSFGRSIRGESIEMLRAQSLASYLCHCPHGNSIGLFRLSILYIMADLGWSEEGVQEALETVRQRGLVRYVFDTEWVWLVDAFRIEMGPDPKQDPKDKKKPDSRRHMISKLLDEASGSGLRKAFLDRYLPDYPHLLGAVEILPEDGASNGASDGTYDDASTVPLVRARRTRSGAGAGSLNPAPASQEGKGEVSPRGSTSPPSQEKRAGERPFFLDGLRAVKSWEHAKRYLGHTYTAVRAWLAIEDPEMREMYERESRPIVEELGFEWPPTKELPHLIFAVEQELEKTWPVFPEHLLIEKQSVSEMSEKSDG